MRFIDRAALIEAIIDLYAGALDHHWQAADYLAEALGWDLDDHRGDLPATEWIRDRLPDVLALQAPTFDPERHRRRGETE